MKHSINIALLYGGTSSERDISIQSGKNVGESLKKSGHNVTYIDPKNETDLDKLGSEKFDVAFIALHGKGGEDGSIQTFLEDLNIPYTGSKVESSKNSIDKAKSKLIYDKAEIPNAEYFVIEKNKDYNLEELIAKTGEDVVVKAATEGSSIGLYFANGVDQIEKEIEKALKFDDTVVVEKRISGREFTVAVLEFPKDFIEKNKDKLNFEDDAAALPVIEIIPKNEYYDFASKYDEGGSKHVCPAEIDEGLVNKLKEAALCAHKALGCSGFSRTDFRVDEQNNIFALETNTIPGMTATSLVPDAARAIGISFDELCELIIDYELS